MSDFPLTSRGVGTGGGGLYHSKFFGEELSPPKTKSVRRDFTHVIIVLDRGLEKRPDYVSAPQKYQMFSKNIQNILFCCQSYSINIQLLLPVLLLDLSNFNKCLDNF